MRKKRTERIRRQENHLAQILNEPDEWSSQRVKESSEHFGLCLYTQRLRFCFWPKLGRNCADETRISRKVMMGLVELEINKVVVPIDSVRCRSCEQNRFSSRLRFFFLAAAKLSRPAFKTRRSPWLNGSRPSRPAIITSGGVILNRTLSFGDTCGDRT